MVKQRSIGPDNMDDGSDGSSAFLDALRTRAMDDLLLAATEYGIVLKDLGVYCVHSCVHPMITYNPPFQLSLIGNSRVRRLNERSLQILITGFQVKLLRPWIS